MGKEKWYQKQLRMVQTVLRSRMQLIMMLKQWWNISGDQG